MITGLLVSIVILQQGWGLLRSAYHDLTDAGASPRTKTSIKKALQPLLAKGETHSHSAYSLSEPAPLLAISHLRARHSGSMLFVDLTAAVPHGVTVEQTSALDQLITKTLKASKKEIAEVRVKFEPR